MKRLEDFMIKIRTGPRGRDTVPRVCINDSDCYELENVEGSTMSGGILQGAYSPHKVIHRFVLEGPDRGCWDLEEAEVTLNVRNREPYSVRLGAVTLDAQSDLNLWYESPEDTFDV